MNFRQLSFKKAKLMSYSSSIGYMMKRNNGSLTPFVSLDFDECYNNSANCDVNAVCTNTWLSYACTCKQGFIGNGTTCEGA